MGTQPIWRRWSSWPESCCSVFVPRCTWTWYSGLTREFAGSPRPCLLNADLLPLQFSHSVLAYVWISQLKCHLHARYSCLYKGQFKHPSLVFIHLVCPDICQIKVLEIRPWPNAAPSLVRCSLQRSCWEPLCAELSFLCEARLTASLSKGMVIKPIREKLSEVALTWWVKALHFLLLL